MSSRLASVVAFAVLLGSGSSQGGGDVPREVLTEADRLFVSMPIEEQLRSVTRFRGTGVWQEYASMLLGKEGSKATLLFQAEDDEYLISFAGVDEKGESSVSTFLYIPNVVSMSRGIPERLAGDAMQLFCREAQSPLALLEVAFPDGPGRIDGTEAATLEQPVKKLLHCLGGMSLLKVARAEVKVSRKSARQIDFVIRAYPAEGAAKEPTIMQGFWSSDTGKMPVNDATPIAGWNVTYANAMVRDAKGKLTTASVFDDTSGFRTLGDIRRAARFQATKRAIQTLKAISTEEELSTFLHGYYLAPKPELVGEAIAYVGKSKIASEHQARAPALAFFSRVFADNPSRTTEWKSVIDKQDPDTREILTKALASTPERLLQSTPPSPALNDMYWGFFFASGDVAYIDRLIEHLGYLDSREDKLLYATGGSAKWSLAANARHHPKVRAAILALRERGTPALRQHAVDMLEKHPGELLR